MRTSLGRAALYRRGEPPRVQVIRVWRHDLATGKHRQSTSWFLRYRLGGRSVCRSTGTTDLAVAERLAREKEAELVAAARQPTRGR